MHACIRVCMYECRHACLHACTYVWMHTRMHVCARAHACTHFQRQCFSMLDQLDFELPAFNHEIWLSAAKGPKSQHEWAENYLTTNNTFFACTGMVCHPKDLLFLRIKDCKQAVTWVVIILRVCLHSTRTQLKNNAISFSNYVLLNKQQWHVQTILYM